MKLVYVTTTFKKLHSHTNVLCSWFFDGPRDEKRPYSLLVDGYEPGDPCVRSAIDELFSPEEAEQLKAYVDRHHGEQGYTDVLGVPLPLSNNIMGLGAISVGGGQKFYMLCDEEGYDLPFKVHGYFDLRIHQIAGEAGKDHEAEWQADLESAASNLAKAVERETLDIGDSDRSGPESGGLEGAMQTFTLLERTRSGWSTPEALLVSRCSSGQSVADDELPV